MLKQQETEEQEPMIDMISEEVEEEDIQFETNHRKHSTLSCSMKETQIRNFSIENQNDLSLAQS